MDDPKSDTQMKSLYRAAAKVQHHETEAMKLFAERQAAVDAALEKWETENQDKAESLKQHQQALQGWTSLYQTLQSQMTNDVMTSPGLPEHVGIERSRAHLYIHESSLQYFMDEPRNRDAISLFMVLDRQRLERFVTSFSTRDSEGKRLEIPDWIADRFTFLDVGYELVFDRDVLAGLDRPDEEEVAPVEPDEDPDKPTQEGKPGDPF